MKFALPLLVIFAITLTFGASVHASIAPAKYSVKVNQHAKQQLRVQSSKQAAQIAQGRYGGKVLKVKKQKSGYRVKLIKKSGHIVSVYVDAKSGSVSGGN